MNIENLRPRPAGATSTIPTAPDIAAQLEMAERDLATLEAEHGTAALDTVAGSPGASDRLAALNRKLSEARDRVSTLSAAHKAAIERDDVAIRAQRAALQKTQIAALRKHLEARDAAAVALTAAIEEAAKQFHALIDRSVKAQAACPIGSKWPVFDEWGAIRRFVANEMFRLSASPGDRDGRALPGAEASGADTEWNPAAIPPLAEEIKKGSRYVLAKITGKAPE